ncbi:MAG: biotin--[acetyl-CoA-carboxylase] ligase, partial [Candidatus Ornithomonoglobus sp.]
NQILHMLKNTESYISGEEMSRALGISRAAVWKHIKKLKDEGYDILSVTNKGYRLQNIPDILSEASISSGLNTEFTARHIKYMPVIDSTNEEVKRCSEMSDGTLFIADVQSAGKGRLGRSWESPKGSGIWMSLLLKPDIPPRDISQITLIAGMAIRRVLGNGAGIKWPNDIVIGSRKVCGILTEMSAEIDRVNYVICGIGINVNTAVFPAELQDKATSLFIETGKTYNRSELVSAIMNEFEPLYKVFQKEGFSPLLEEYRNSCITIGREIRVIYRKETLIGKAVDIAPDGGLIVETENGRVNVTSGDVSVRGIYGYI